MEYLPNGFTLELCEGAFPLSTDSIALAGFVKLPRNASVLDLGSGCGTLGMLLCATNSTCSITGIELDENAHCTAIQNAKSNLLESRFTSICGDLREVTESLTPGSFDVCVSNPPYFTGGPESKRTPIARRDDSCSIEALMKAAGRSLKFGGDFFLIHKPERLAELIACAAAQKLEAKKLCLLRHKSDGPIALVLIQFRKGAKPGLTWQEVALHHPDGTPTDYYRNIYHL